MRWNETIELLGRPSVTQDEAGNTVHGEAERRMRFCNPYTVGASDWATAMDLGLRLEAEVQVRSVDYAGETECVYRGVQYDISKVTHSGEIVNLQLSRRANNE